MRYLPRDPLTITKGGFSMEKMNTIYFDDECVLFFDRYEKYEIEEDGFPVDLNDYDEENY